MAKETPETGFTLTPVESKPTRKYRKGSKYDPLMDAFHKGDQELVAVNIEGKDANYIRTQLNKRIEAHPRKYKGIKVSVVNDTCYLDKRVTPEE